VTIPQLTSHRKDGLEKFLGRKGEGLCDDEGRELGDSAEAPQDPMEHNEEEGEKDKKVERKQHPE